MIRRARTARSRTVIRWPGASRPVALAKLLPVRPSSLAFSVICRANSSSEPAIASAIVTQASLPDWMMMPRIRSSTFTRSPTFTNICEPPIFQARSLTRTSSSSLSLPCLIWSKIR